MAHPRQSETLNVEPSSLDVLLYLALNEEFETAMALLGQSFVPEELPGVTLTAFFGDIWCEELQRSFRIAVLPAGKMGNTRSASVVSAAIEKLAPANIVVLGIAGSLTPDLEPGDVFVPDSINEYLANSAAVGEEDSWSLRTSGNHFHMSGRLLNRFQVFEHVQRSYYNRWRADTARYRAELIDPTTEQVLRSADLALRGDCRLFAGDDRKLASGPAVGKSKAFVEWISKGVDRKVAAIEMESAGVFDAALIHEPAPRIIAIRGISDFADARKDKIEDTAKTRFRELAARNALSLLIRGIEAGLLRPEGAPTIDIRTGKASIAQSRLRSVFVIGGVTEETADPGAELPRLHRASLKLGKLLASAGAQLLICSPFPDSADYYIAMGYAEGEGQGAIHMHSPSHPKVVAKRDLLVKSLGREGLIFQDWRYPGPDNEDSWPQAWLLAQLQALERADLVVALGGKVSKTANTLLHLAEARGLPVVPFAFLGGAAKRAFNRRDWKRIHPDLDASIMERDAGIDQTIDIANTLILERIQRSFRSSHAPNTLFVSFARKDLDSGKAVANFMRQRGLEVLTGDDETGSEQMIPASIEQALLKSGICIVLWSQNYAVSPWCYDELIMATRRQSLGAMSIWLFNLDDSLVVPTEARKLPVIAARTPTAIVSALEGLLSHWTK